MFAAIRRRWWMVGLLALVGVLPSLVLKSSGTTEYESHAVLLIAPPGQGVVAGDDRYVDNQRTILGSQAVAARVAEAVGRGLNAQSVALATKIETKPGTDVLDIMARGATPLLAQQIAEQYLTIYLEDLRTRADETRGPEIAQLDAKLAELAAQIKVLNTRISDAVQKFPRSVAGEFASPSIADPASTSERDALQSQYLKVLDTKTALDLASTLRVNSEIVQHATLPTFPIQTSSSKLLFAGVFVGAVAGLVAAVMAARVSRFVLDSVHAEEILGFSLPHVMERSGALARNRRTALENLPSDAVGVIDQICVQAEGAATLGSALTVAVVGTQRGAGTTTLALAMAGRFANNGSSVVLVDADPKKPQLTRLYDAADAEGVPAMLELATMPPRPDGRPDWWISKKRSVYADTRVPEVRLLGSGSHDAATLRREDISTLLAGAASGANVVIVDGGAVLDAASTLQLCQLADVVVLAIPTHRQRVGSLQAVKRQLASRVNELIPVMTSPSKPSRWRHRDRDRDRKRRKPAAPKQVKSDVVEPVEDARDREATEYFVEAFKSTSRESLNPSSDRRTGDRRSAGDDNDTVESSSWRDRSTSRLGRREPVDPQR